MPAGQQTRTTDGVIGTSGVPIIVYGVNIIDDGTASVVAIYDGTSASGTLRIKEKTTAGIPLSQSYPTDGLIFQNGCFVDVDAHTTQITVAYKTVI